MARIEHCPRPQRSLHIFQQFGIKFLPAEPGVLISRLDRLQEWTGEVRGVFKGRPPGYDHVASRQQFLDQSQRSRGCGRHPSRMRTQAQGEH
jgi:hypothetical protein